MYIIHPPNSRYVESISNVHVSAIFKVISKVHLNFHRSESANALHTRLATWQSWEQTARQVIACRRKLLADTFLAECQKSRPADLWKQFFLIVPNSLALVKHLACGVFCKVCLNGTLYMLMLAIDHFSPHQCMGYII